MASCTCRYILPRPRKKPAAVLPWRTTSRNYDIVARIPLFARECKGPQKRPQVSQVEGITWSQKQGLFAPCKSRMHRS